MALIHPSVGEEKSSIDTRSGPRYTGITAFRKGSSRPTGRIAPSGDPDDGRRITLPNEACRMNRILIPLVLAGLSFSCCIIDPIIQDPAGEEASVTVSSISIPTQDFTAGLVPFTDYRGPYHRLNDANPPVRNRTWKTVELSNRYVKVVAVPELGGRILKFVNLATGNNEFYENPEGIKVNGWGRNGWWAATGGVEFMFPFDEHGGGFYLPYNHAKNPDAGAEWRTEKTGSGVTLSMGFSEKEQFGLVRWRHDLEIEVPNAGAYFTVTHTVTNESAVTRDLMFWSNAMISPGPGNMRVSSLSSLDHRSCSTARSRGRTTTTTTSTRRSGATAWEAPVPKETRGTS
jgi:hypothetical protein